jgi:hypothetical protein
MKSEFRNAFVATLVGLGGCLANLLLAAPVGQFVYNALSMLHITPIGIVRAQTSSALLFQVFCLMSVGFATDRVAGSRRLLWAVVAGLVMGLSLSFVAPRIYGYAAPPDSVNLLPKLTVVMRIVGSSATGGWLASRRRIERAEPWGLHR